MEQVICVGDNTILLDIPRVLELVEPLVDKLPYDPAGIKAVNAALQRLRDTLDPDVLGKPQMFLSEIVNIGIVLKGRAGDEGDAFATAIFVDTMLCALQTISLMANFEVLIGSFDISAKELVERFVTTYHVDDIEPLLLSCKTNRRQTLQRMIASFGTSDIERVLTELKKLDRYEVTNMASLYPVDTLEGLLILMERGVLQI